MKFLLSTTILGSTLPHTRGYGLCSGEAILPKTSLASPKALTIALALRDKWMKQGGSVQADYITVVNGDRKYVEGCRIASANSLGIVEKS
jgi:hypothetical protein